MSLERISVLTSVLFALALAGAPAASAAPRAAIEPVKVAPQAPVVQGDTVRLRFPITLRPGVRARALYAEVLAVSLPDRAEHDFYDAFSASVARASNGRGPALLLDIATRPKLVPGTYAVTVLVRRRSPARPRGRRVRISVRIPTADLKDQGKLRIRRTEQWPFHDAVSGPPPLRLREQGRRSRIADIEIDVSTAATAGGKQADGSVKVSPPAGIPAGGGKDATVTVQDDFPIGTAAGTITVDSPQLAAPADIDYEVVTERSKVLLVVLLAFGIGLSYVTRQLLQSKLEEDTAKASGYELLSTMDRRMGEHPDAEFVREVRRARGDLEAALETETAAIAAATVAANATLAAQIKSLQERATLAASALEAYRAALGTGWTLPPAVQAVVVDETQRLAKMAATLRAGRVAQAQQALDERTGALRMELNTAYAEWHDAATALVRHATDPAGCSLALGDAESLAAAGEASTALQAVGAERAASVEVILERIDAAFAAIGDFLVELRISSSVVVRDTRATLGGDTQAIDAALGSLLQGLDAGRNSGDLRAILATLESLENAMATAVRAKGQPSDEVNAALAEGQFADAAKAAGAGGPVRLKSGGGAPALAAATTRRRARETRAPGLRLPDLLSVGPSIPSAGEQAARLRRGIGKTRLWQDLLIALAVAVAGYLLFADGWTGTTDDIVQILAWAFGADLSLVFLQSAFQRPQPAAPNPPNPPAG